MDDISRYQGTSQKTFFFFFNLWLPFLGKPLNGSDEKFYKGGSLGYFRNF